jgi:fatty-acyl-CoA synthase
MRGLLQDEPLTLRCLFERLERQFAGRTVATARGGQVVRRRSYADLARRARRTAAALDAAGVGPGERVATLAFNSDDHLELMLGICAAGRVFHALNPRLPREELDWIVHHAGDAMLFVDRELLAHWNALPPPACVREVVVIESPDESPDRGLRDYQAFLDAAGDHDSSFVSRMVPEHSAQSARRSTWVRRSVPASAR